MINFICIYFIYMASQPDIDPNELLGAMNVKTGLDYTKSSLKNEMDFVITKTAYKMEAMITSIFEELQNDLKTTFENIIHSYPVKKLQNHLTTLTPMYTVKTNKHKRICGGKRTRKNKKQNKIYGGEGLLENTMYSFENYIYQDTQPILIDEINNSVSEVHIKKSFLNALYKTSYSIPILANNAITIQQLENQYETMFFQDKIDDILKQSICSQDKLQNKLKMCMQGGGDVGIKAIIKRYVRNKIIYTLTNTINSTICKQLKLIFGEIFKTSILENQFSSILDKIQFKDLCKTKQILKLVRPKYRLQSKLVNTKQITNTKRNINNIKEQKIKIDSSNNYNTERNQEGQIRIGNMNHIENLINEKSESIKSFIESILTTETNTMTRYIHNGLTDYYTSILSNKRMGRLFIQTIENKANKINEESNRI